MSPTLALILALLAAQTGLTADPKIDENELKRIWEREEDLHQEMSRLLQEIEGSTGTMQTLLCPALKQHWLFWGSAAALVLVLLPRGFCPLRRRRHGSVSCREQEGAKGKKVVMLKFSMEGRVSSDKFGYEKVNSKEKENVSSQEKGGSREKFSSQEKVGSEEKVKGADSGGSTLAVPTPSAMGTSRIRLERAVSSLVKLRMSLLMAVGSHWMAFIGYCQAQLFCDCVILQQGLPSTKVLKELVDELLRVCRVLSQRNSMPELHLDTGMDTSSAAWSIQGNSSTFRLLVILQPPPGYSFHTHSTEQPPAGCIHVALECLCSGEQLLGQTCFLHASGVQLPRDQNLPDTLCTGSCLDAKKVIRWVQMLVSSAWLLLPQSCYYQLTVLPSSKSCSWQLSSTSGLHCRIEMDLAVQECSSGAYLSLE